MCGIVGFITAETTIGAIERKRWFLNALRAGVVRGDDGTGVFLVAHDQEGNADWCKMAGPPEPFLSTKHAMERLGYSNDFAQYRAVIGHNRSATVGSVSTENAHPFQEGPITLVHNGTLNSTHNLPTPKSKLKGADVDSHMITHNLATHSVSEVVKELDGAYVLIWHDERDQSVNIIRNDKRPLHLLPLKYHNTILLASEAEMLWWLTERSSFTPAGDIYYPEPGYHLKFTSEGGIKPHVTKLDMYKWRYSGPRGHWRGYEEWDDSDYGPWYGRGAGKGMSSNTEGSNMGKVPERPALSGPHLNTQSLNRRVPTPLARTLEDMNLLPLDKLRMQVTHVQPVHGTPHAVAIGRLVDLPFSPTAHVLGLAYAAIKDAGTTQEMWTVAPNGVKAIGYNSNIVLARLLARTAKMTSLTETAPSLTSLQVTPATSSTNDGEEDYTLWDSMSPQEQEEWLSMQEYYAPSGEKVPYSTWMELVSGGCCYCRESIEPEFVEDMSWDEETKLPICPECTVNLEDEENDYSAAV